MTVGERYTFNGLTFEVQRERGDYSCSGCAFSFVNRKGLSGCLAKRNELSTCKRDHVILVIIDGDRNDNFIERRRNLVLNR